MRPRPSAITVGSEHPAIEGDPLSVHLELGADVRCEVVPVGELADVVLDPVSRTVTHVVVQLHHEGRAAYLVALDLVGDSDGEEPDVTLGCTAAELRGFELVRDFAYLPVGGVLPHGREDRDLGVTDVVAAPLYDAAGIDLYVNADPSVGITYDLVP